ncbi:MAG TPA: DNA-directed RNA polymerase subunit alpha C-terminal domain-containing protein [Thermoguttaceae bacterium]|nr:DNA-directed RNA polymerase subunit alpha C-terminal domain-containing protein [Thermoguttaceae bacterium]
MAHALEFDLKQVVLLNGSFGPREIEQLADAVASDPSQFHVLRDAVDQLQAKEETTPASMVRLGVCSYLLGRFNKAIDTLKRGDGGALAHFYLAKSYFARQKFPEALESYEAAAAAGYNSDACAVGRAEALRYAGDAVGALATLDGLSGAVEQTAEYLAQRAATVAALGGNPAEVVALYERAVEADRTYAGALFGLALENDRRGNDETALELYKRATGRFPTHIGSLLNLGLLYEDRRQFDRAAQCYQRVLDVYPDHDRAMLFLKDTEASSDQFYDEDAQKKRDRISQVLSIPVTDFELSVRSRNCLQKMGIMTLGDLCRCSEQELLSSKNFGETSLTEIREMVGSKGLRLGQFAPERHVAEIFEPEALSPDEVAVLGRPIAELNLSVRARKCMIRLGINTIGELVRRTGDDLLECKNFGVTSLNEVREKLSLQGLKLRGE